MQYVFHCFAKNSLRFMPSNASSLPLIKRVLCSLNDSDDNNPLLPGAAFKKRSSRVSRNEFLRLWTRRGTSFCDINPLATIESVNRRYSLFFPRFFCVFCCAEACCQGGCVAVMRGAFSGKGQGENKRRSVLTKLAINLSKREWDARVKGPS